MSQFRFAAWLLVLVSPLLTAIPVEANFHFWEIKEVYTNSDGSVQFIELFCPVTGQQFLSGHTISANSDGTIRTFTFPGNSGTPTTNKHLLIATSSFGPLTGSVTPNYTFLPAQVPFFIPNATTITINFGEGSDIWTFTGASLPKDGVNSLTDTILSGNSTNLITRVNSPTNFAGTAGSLNRGDYNSDGVVDAADYIVYRKTLALAASPAGVGADGNTNGTIDAGDYTLWRARFGNLISGAGGGAGTNASVPEPSTFVSLLVGLVLVAGFITSRKTMIG